MYGRSIEIHVKGGGKLNTISFDPGQKEPVKKNGYNLYFNREGAINHAKMLMSRWYSTDQFRSAKLTWRVA